DGGGGQRDRRPGRKAGAIDVEREITESAAVENQRRGRGEGEQRGAFAAGVEPVPGEQVEGEREERDARRAEEVDEAHHRSAALAHAALNVTWRIFVRCQ